MRLSAPLDWFGFSVMDSLCSRAECFEELLEIAARKPEVVELTCLIALKMRFYFKCWLIRGKNVMRGVVQMVEAPG